MIYALGRLVQSESEINCMLGAWETYPELCGKFSLHLTTLQEMTRDQRLAISYMRFIDSTMFDTNETIKKPSRPILRNLVGDDSLRWRQHNWEQRWQLSSSSSFRLETFSSSGACEEIMVKRILHGFSIPQADADATSAPLDLQSFLLSLDLNELLGLRHKVDVTLVRDGVTHPDWKLSDVLQFEDIMDAFRNKYTIGIRGVHARSHMIASVCNALQNDLKQHVNANIYCESCCLSRELDVVRLADSNVVWLGCCVFRVSTGTPPGEQGFNLHIDDHCGTSRILSGPVV